MKNPTTNAKSQFTKPFDILPNNLYTNPTTNAKSQFISPFDILPNNLYTNPTTNAKSQFTKPFDILPNQNYNTTEAVPALPISATTQFTKPFDILPNQNYNTTEAIPKLPISAPKQFTKPFDILPNIKIDNPTNPLVTNFVPGIPKFGISDYKQGTLGNFKNFDGEVKDTGSAIWKPNSTENTNITLQSVGAKAAAFGLSSLGGFTGIPYTAQVGQSLTGVFGDDNLSGEFITLTQDQLKRIPGVLYADFRSRLGLKNNALSFTTSKRLDGTAAAIRKGWRGGIYAGASVSPAGPYSIFNIETLYGWGEHDNPNAIRSDFTLRSHVATKWIPAVNQKEKTGNSQATGKFISTKNVQELATPFRGDKISVIDFSKRKLGFVYDWKRSYSNEADKKDYGKFINAILNNKDLTQDFIKFYFTGPKLYAENENEEDDIIVFRAVITSFSENFNPTWTDQKMIGRADPNYMYSGVTRDLSIDFDIYATDRDELKPIYRKLNALAGYTAPTYLKDSIAMQAPWMRLTIGDLYYHTPVVMNSLGYTYAMDAPWEINIENDPTMMQVPKKISVSCQFNVITDYLPQKGGRFWTLAKRFESDATPKAGDDNWLSDSLGNIDEETLQQKKLAGLGTKIKEKFLKNKILKNKNSDPITETVNSVMREGNLI